jgi:Ser/Thr protein kinase RdoA (MazF antagonist)
VSQIAINLYWLHIEGKTCHYDLKPANVFVNKEDLLVLSLFDKFFECFFKVIMGLHGMLIN